MGRNDNEGRGNRRSRGGYNNRRGRGRYNNRRQDPRAASRSGNKRERIAVESGFLVLIDQFMLANDQFIDKIAAVVEEDPSVKDKIISDYGGSVVELQPGTYRIDRDPYAFTIVIHGDEAKPEIKKVIKEAAESNVGEVFVDTRCLAMIDRELLDDSALLVKYRQLWVDGEEKACRDLLRDNGGAVRYGFSRYGDELGVYMLEDQDVVCLWPEKAEVGEADTETAEVAPVAQAEVAAEATA